MVGVPGYAPWMPWNGTYQIGEASRVTVSTTGLGRLRLSIPPSSWLHFRHSMRVFASVSAPPWLWGITWSTSALLGRSEYSQSSPVRHRGHRVCPCSKAMARASLTRFFHLAVAVRLVAI